MNRRCFCKSAAILPAVAVAMQGAEADSGWDTTGVTDVLHPGWKDGWFPVYHPQTLEATMVRWSKGRKETMSWEAYHKLYS